MHKILITGLIGATIFAVGCTDAANPPVSVRNSATPDSTATTANTKAVDEHGHKDNAERITLAEAKKEFDAGNAVFIDTRSADSYNQEHIKGALNITIAEIGAKADTIPKGKKIIAYCS